VSEWSANARAGQRPQERSRHTADMSNKVVLGDVRAMRRAERSQGDLQLAIGDADVACRAEQLMQKGLSLIIDTGVVRSHQRNELVLRLIG